MCPAFFSVQVAVERETVASLRGRSAYGSPEFLVFKLSDEEVGVNSLSVQGTRSFEVSNRATNIPAYVPGLLSLSSADMGLVSACLQ